MKEAVELQAQKEICDEYKKMVVELEKQLSAEKANFDKKKGILKKRLAEAEWLNSEYQHDINGYKKQIKEKQKRLDYIELELGKKEGSM